MAIKGFVIGQIVVFVMLLLLLLAVIFTTVYFALEKKNCETTQSPFCLAVACPNTGGVAGSGGGAPCYGYAQRDTNAGTVCSSGPQIVPN